MNLVSVISKCREQAEAQSMSLATLGQKIGVSRGQVCNWFHGRRTPSAAHLWALIDAVGFQMQLVKEEKQVEPSIANPGDTVSTKPIVHKKTSAAKEIKPIRSAPAFENLTPAEIETARKLFGLDLSGNA